MDHTKEVGDLPRVVSSFQGRRVELPNDLKLSDSGSRCRDARSCSLQRMVRRFVHLEINSPVWFLDRLDMLNNPKSSVQQKLRVGRSAKP